MMRGVVDDRKESDSRVARSRPILKSPREIELMRAAGRIVYKVLGALREAAEPGVTTGELGRIADEIITAHGGEALFRGVQTQGVKFPFPAAICASVNEQVVHGIPGERVLKEGDIVSVDCGVRLRGYCGDSATTLAIGNIRPEIRRLLDVTNETLELAIREMAPGRMWSEIASRMQAKVQGAGYTVVREFVGHGIGQDMHEEPKVPNYSDRKQLKSDFRLDPGLVLAVEPMVNQGSAEVKSGDWTGWPQVTKDGKWSAHFEHTVAITQTGIDILTDGR